MFNSEFKKQYLKEKSKNTILPDNYNKYFEVTEKMEEMLDKDLCNWSLSNIIDFFNWYGTSSIHVVTVMTSAYSQYTEYCLTKGQIKDGQNHFADLTSEIIMKRCINQSIARDVLSKDEVYDIISKLNNDCDKFLILAIFEGIKGVNCKELINAKITDITGNEIILSSGRKVIMSDKLKEIAYKSAAQEYYVNESGREAKLSTEDNDAIIKQRMSTNRVSSSKYGEGHRIFIYFQKAIKQLHAEHNITMNSLWNSGRINYVKELIQTEDAKINNVNDLNDFVKRYSKEIKDKYGSYRVWTWVCMYYDYIID